MLVQTCSKKIETWIPVKGDTGVFPQDEHSVQVTFLSFFDHKTPYCDAFAYRKNGKWYWSLDDSDVTVEITAWKNNCEPYKG